MLNLQNINLKLGNKNVLELQILKNLNLTVKTGDFVVVIGENGAGKSTIFNVISGFLKPDNGVVLLDNKNITNISQEKRCSDISIVMQDPKIGTIENMTIFENMAFAIKRGSQRSLMPFSNKNRRKYCQEKLSKLNMGLENRLDDLVVNLSGGQRQALSLLMAILTPSKILLLDEITAALDPTTAKNIIQLANKIIREENRTCIMITHNMNQAIKYGNRIILLDKGQFVKEFKTNDKNKITPEILANEFRNL